MNVVGLALEKGWWWVHHIVILSTKYVKGTLLSQRFLGR